MPDFLEVKVHNPASWCFPDQKLFLIDLVNQEQNYLAATLNTHTGETVKRGFQDNHKGSVKLSDSQVTLH